MKKHNILYLILSCALILVLAGCGGKVVDGGPDSSSQQSSASESISSEEASSEQTTSAESSEPTESDANSSEESSNETSSAEESEPESVPEQPAAPLTPEDTSSTTERPQQTVNNSKPYLIKVNRVLNTATVYQKDDDGKFTDPVKAIVVSCGGSNTPIGTFRISVQYRWKLMMDDVYAQYASRVTGPILIHSVPYYTPSNSDLCYRQYNLLGQTASHGCIRMTVEDAKWVMDHCSVGTTVEIYDDSSSPGPLGKPKAQKIPLDSKYRGWDPTDPDSRNPWHQLGEPKLKGIKDRTVELGGKFDPLSKVTASDGTGKDITENIQVAGKVNTKAVGEYKLTYRVEDDYGNFAEKKAMVTVRDTTAPTIQISSTKAFAAESESAGCEIIRSRISFRDLSEIADSSVKLILVDKQTHTETITVPAKSAKTGSSEPETTSISERASEQESSSELPSSHESESASESETTSVPESSEPESTPPAEQTITRTTVTYTYAAQITVSDCYGNQTEEEAVFTFTVTSETAAS